MIERLAVILVLLCSLVACSEDKGEVLMEDYVDRLSNVLDVDREESTVPQEPLTGLPRFKPPTVHDALDEAPEQTLTLLEYLSVFGCELQVLISQRNSSLGKLAQPSQQLVYELKFLQAAPACIEALDAEEEHDLAEKLRQVWEQKQDALPGRVWWTLLAGEEARRFWKRSSHWPDYPDSAGSDVVRSLNWLTAEARRWLAGDYTVESAALESHLAILGTGDGGALGKALARYQHGMAQANRMLDKKAPHLCFKNHPRYNAIAARHVIHNLFIGQVQPWASQLSQRYYTLMTAYRALEHVFENAEPPAYRAWRMRRDEAFEHALKASIPHVKRLKWLLDGCPCVGCSGVVGE